MSPIESVILCEGYHDRAFWAGWLTRLRCEDLRPAQGRQVLDPWGTRVAAGQFAFRSRSGVSLRVQPCHGRENVRMEAETRLGRRTTRRLARMVICLDADTEVESPRDIPTPAETSVRELLGRLGAESGDAPDHYSLAQESEGRATVSLIVWQAPDPAVDALPKKQTLERLVCAAIKAAYPERGPAVRKWLAGRPGAPAPGPKHFAWSHMAGWYAEAGCEAFYRRIWEDNCVAAELE